jgi:hypothetical protein
MKIKRKEMFANNIHMDNQENTTVEFILLHDSHNIDRTSRKSCKFCAK